MSRREVKLRKQILIEKEKKRATAAVTVIKFIFCIFLLNFMHDAS